MESGWFTIIGVILGAILSPIGTYFLLRFKRKQDEEIHIRRKREDLYLEAIDCLSVMQEKIKPHVEKDEAGRTAKEIKRIVSNLYSRFALYSSTKVRTKFATFIPIASIIYNLSDMPEASKLRQEQYNIIVLSNSISELIEMMKEEIGTAEKQKAKGFQYNLCSWIQSKFSAK